MLFTGLVLLTIVICIPFVYWYYLYYIKYGSFRKLPGPKPTPILGNEISNDSVGIMQDMQALYEKYKHRFVIWTGLQVRVIHSQPEHLSYILNAYNHIDKSDNFDVLKGWIGEGLATSRGDKWRHRRKLINQSFNMNLMERFVKVFNSVGNILIKKLEKEVEKDIDLIKFTNFSALDIACETLMGIQLNSQQNENQEYVHQTKELLKIVGVRFFSFWQRFESLFLLFSRQKDVYIKYATDLKQFTLNVINQRRKTYTQEKKGTISKDEFGRKRKAALMDILLEEEEKGTMDFEGVREEIDTFIVAGHETSAGILAFILLELAKAPDLQQTLYEEIMAVAPDGDLTMDQISQMNYCEQVVKEALRLYPQVPFMERQIMEEFELDGIKYPVGTVFGIPIISMHYDPDYFPNPTKFDPSRFAPENIDKIPKYTYLPFSAGPRICIGYKYAIWSAKTSVAKLIREFEVFPVPGFEVEFEFQITLKSARGVHVKLRKREHV